MARLGRNVYALGAVSFFTDVSSEMIYPLLPAFITGTLGGSASMLGAIEGAAETTASLLKLASGWLSDRMRARKPLVVVGYALAALVRPLIAVAQSASQVLAIRMVDRVGKGIRGAPRDALIADSVDGSIRGRAFGFHRAADHAGAVIGPLIAFAILTVGTVPLRSVFWYAAIPGVIAVLIAVFVVREPRREDAPDASVAKQPVPHRGLDLSPGLGRRFWKILAVIFLFTLGNSTDAFLLLRAAELGVPLALAPILWAVLHVVKSMSSTPGGSLSDRIGRRPVIIAGWLFYAVIYALFGMATETWHAWALFAAYGVYFGLTEGSERALVADLIPQDRRGAAFGWYNAAIGAGALPASIIFGLLWDRAGSGTAFAYGASMAAIAAVLLWVVGGEASDRKGVDGV